MVVAMPLISRMVSLMPPIAMTQSPVADWIAVTWPAISSVAFAVWLASSLTSEATTAKPRPASPARAASMVALSARRLVWLAMAPISRSTSPIFSPAAVRPATISVVCPALTTAWSATPLEWVTWRPISATEEASSSVAAATVETLAEASSEAAAAAAARSEVPLTLEVISPATRCMSLVALATAPTTPLTSASKRSAIWRCSAFFSSSACALAASCASRIALASIMLRRNTSTATAMVPSSSLRSPPGMVTSVSPLDSRFITAVIAASGRDMPRPSRNASSAANGQNAEGDENQGEL